MSNAPPLVPAHEAHGTVYLVLDDFGQLGRIYRETDETTDARSVIRDMVQGEYHRPVRVVAFNAEEGWSRDVSSEIARRWPKWQTNKNARLLPRPSTSSARTSSPHNSHAADVGVLRRERQHGG